jgi:endonuclease/exonuclease/phosphatase family metal-dependent hydrolase
MVWRSDRFKLSNKQVYWLSPTPDTPSKAWEENVKHWRFVMSAKVKDKKTGLEFIFMVTHCPLMKSVNEKAAKLIVEREKLMNPEDEVVIFVGDMNSRIGSPYTQIIRTHFTDTRDIAAAKSEISGTMNGAEVRETPKDYTLDYIYIRGSKLKYEVLRHDVLVDKYKVNGKEYFPSDHCPVTAIVKLTNN